MQELTLTLFLQSAHAVLQTGADYAFLHQAYYTRSLFILSKIMLFLCEKRFQEANPLLQQISPDIENWVISYQVTAAGVSLPCYLLITFLVTRACWARPWRGSRRSTCRCTTSCCRSATTSWSARSSPSSPCSSSCSSLSRLHHVNITMTIQF